MNFGLLKTHFKNFLGAQDPMPIACKNGNGETFVQKTKKIK
jgi:hypothetical protein